MRASKQLVGGGFAALLIVAAIGCGSSDKSGSSRGTSMDAMADQVDAQNAARKKTEAAAAAKAASDQQVAAAQPVEPEKKAVGSRSTTPFGGYYGAIAGARRHVMNVADSLRWIQGVRSFKAEEGRKPKNTDEFMKVVVPRYELQLQSIEADEEFLYDPNGETDGDFGQLYVVKKETASAATQSPEAAPAQK